jgi:putative signal transducing protein
VDLHRSRRRPAYNASIVTEQNSESERQRLTELYASMADGELEKLAGEAATLSDIAREALSRELSNRKIHVALQSASSATEREKDEHPALVTIRRFLNVRDAQFAKSLLESAGIECFLADENMVGLNFWPSMIEGAKLWVRQEDVEEAEAILDQHRPSNTR